jgi:N-methylhydantoinase A/oxoprolinase/acetone carboxylase beta subunit
MAKVRIGIDVGGTFTHAVAVDGSSSEILGHSVVPTTHFASEGVAEGIVQSLRKLIEQSSINISDVTFIAHSTTQATNALLEGDVAKVGIAGIGKGVEGRRAAKETNVGAIKLSGGKEIETSHEFFSDKADVKVQDMVGAVVAAEAFSVDDPTGEQFVIEAAKAKGLPACGTHEISGLYGLRARTRTSVVNASVLPKMLEAADMTDRAIRECGISSGLMVMRSDGGVLSLDEVRKRPILTMLSGPAAGVAAALMYERVSDGIFIEVGGTSTDITVIKDGKALVKSAEVGGHKLYLKTLDVRTVGLAGGSIPRAAGGRIVDVGPRSAHIAGLPYSCFSEVKEIADSKPERFRPREGDPGDYVCLASPDGSRYAVTVTCVANALGFVPAGDYAAGEFDSARMALELLSKELGGTPEDIGGQILDVSSRKFVSVIENLIKEYKLDRENVVLVGGGGGASAIVPYLAQKMKLDHRIVKRNEIISAIGVALALLHDRVERSVINPTEEDILKIRHEAEERVLSMGARPESVEITMEVDPKKNVVRASAFGSTDFSAKRSGSGISADNKMELASKSMRIPLRNVRLLGETSGLAVLGGRKSTKRFFGLINKISEPVRIIDGFGVVRLQRSDASLHKSSVKSVCGDLKGVLESEARYGDAGASFPSVFILYGNKILDLSGLNDESQMIGLVGLEVRGAPKDDPALILSSRS